MRLIGLVANDPEKWKQDVRCPVRWKELSSVHQVFEVLRSQTVDVLALELKWFEDTAWMAAILEQSWTTPVGIVLLVEYEQRQWLPVARKDFSAELCLPEAFGCVRIDIEHHTVWHQGRELSLPWRAAELLAVLGQRPGIPVTLDAVNQVSAEIGWPTWTESTTKVAVHQIRRALGESHVETIRRHGYLFAPCQP